MCLKKKGNCHNLRIKKKEEKLSIVISIISIVIISIVVSSRYKFFTPPREIKQQL